MRKFAKRKALLVSGGLFVMIALIVICVSPRPIPVDVDVTFTGFTNFKTSPLTAASFCVSNCGKISVIQWPMSSRFEFKSPSSDILLGHFSAGTLWMGGQPRILKPGETLTLYITTPTKCSRPWRVWYGFARADWRLKLDRLPARAHGILARVIPRKWLVISPEIEVAPDWVVGPKLEEPESGDNQLWESPKLIGP